MTLRVFIVDDEPIARRHLERLIGGVEEAVFAGEAADGPSALAKLEREPADIAFVDIRMPGFSGLELVRRLAKLAQPPAVVFTTAHDEHALAAFELGAVDYLLKPFGAARFKTALERAARLRLASERADALARATQTLTDTRGPLTRVFVRSGQRIVQLPVDAIERFEAQDDYVVAHAEGGEHVLAVRMAALERRLASPPFVRIHRSHIINLDHLATFVRRADSRVDARMKSGATVTASRARSQDLRDLTL